MLKRIDKIRTPLIDNFNRIIKNLAKRGRNNYQEYLVQPLAQWSTITPAEPLDKLQLMLDNAINKKNSSVSLIYKMILIKSVSEDQLNLSIPGNLSLDFLNAMKYNKDIRKSDQAIEFINILRDPFKVYSEQEFIRMNKQFKDDITTADTLEVEKIISAKDKSEDEEIQKEKLSRKSIKTIKDIVKKGDENQIKKSIISYLLKFSDPSSPDRHLAINKIFQDLKLINESLEKEIMDSTAVVIYHEILKTIKDSKLDKTIKYIGKYTVLFRGDPDIPNYHEVDSFEKQFFKILEDRNLWDKI